MIVKVRCTFDIDVEFDESERERIEFIVEDNGCPGTGKVGAAIEKWIEEREAQDFCWACGLNSSNTIIAIDGVPQPLEMRVSVGDFEIRSDETGKGKAVLDGLDISNRVKKAQICVHPADGEAFVVLELRP